MEFFRKLSISRIRKALRWSAFSRRKPIVYSSAEDELSLAIREMESAFGHIGSSLSALDEKTKTLSADCHDLVSLAAGHKHGADLLNKGAAILKGPIQYVTDSSAEYEKIIQLMRECERRAKTLLARQVEMITVLEPLQFMLMFFKIEAAKLESEHQSTFLTVSDEILRLHEMVSNTFHQNIDQLNVARESIASAMTRIERDHQMHSREVIQKRSEISKALDTLDTQLKENELKDTDLNVSAESFNQHMGRLVGALQYEDIFRQRCESILEDFQQLPSDVSSQALALLQAMRIETAATELEMASREVSDGLEAILSLAVELDEISTTMNQFEHITASSDGMVQVLLEAFESIRSTLGETDQLSRVSHDTIKPIQALSEGLSVVVLEVSTKIQFIALNAQVRSIQVGEGSALEVLAAQTADVSSSLRSLGDETSREIVSLSHAVQQLMELISSSRSANEEQSSILGEEGESLSEQLHSMRNQTLESLQVIGETMDSVREIIDQGRGGLHTLPNVATDLKAIARNIRQQAELDRASPDRIESLKEELGPRLEACETAKHTSLRVGFNSPPAAGDDMIFEEDQLVQAAATGDVELF